MKNPFKRDRSSLEDELDRLIERASKLDPIDSDYEAVLDRIDNLDRILNRTTEMKKTVIPALGAAVGVAAIYAVQQFGGVLVPKAMDTIASRNTQKNHRED